MSYPYPSASSLERAMVLLKAAQIPKRAEPKPEFESLSPIEAAQQLNVGVRVIRRAIRERRLAAYRVGSRNWRIRVIDLENYVENLISEWKDSFIAKPQT